jgi:trehalose-6-phosphate synthase
VNLVPLISSQCIISTFLYQFALFSDFTQLFSHQTIKKDEFYALLSVADLGVITPLRDGMNTTSMEFVMAQERTYKSPLVLSEFMGITGHMADAL